ncbi:uncharacterized protein CTRU02_211021 [Colletotrichum truncatum]|uniref:Uncharacterized protein n=1 Tax=Colletotrichum truncatum TaxID=5467 RepID=A0ACC3YQV5_COLTU
MGTRTQKAQGTRRPSRISRKPSARCAARTSASPSLVRPTLR